MFWLKAVKMTANKREFLFSNNSFPCCYAPINVKPTGGGGGGAGQGGDLAFFKNLQSNSLPTSKSFQSNAANFPAPGCTLRCPIPQGWTQLQERHNKKISPNKTLKSLFILRYCITKDTIPVTGAIIRFHHNPCYTA